MCHFDEFFLNHKFYTRVVNIQLEGTVSRILFVGHSFYSMRFRKKNDHEKIIKILFFDIKIKLNFESWFPPNGSCGHACEMANVYMNYHIHIFLFSRKKTAYRVHVVL